MTDTEQVNAWNALLVSAKKWGRPVRWQELEAAVQMIERLMALNWKLDRMAYGDATGAVNTFERHKSYLAAKQEATLPAAPTNPIVLGATGWAESPEHPPAAVQDLVFLLPDPQIPPTTALAFSEPSMGAKSFGGAQPKPTDSPRTKQPRQDRARAFNDFAKACRATGMTQPEVLVAWRAKKSGP